MIDSGWDSPESLVALKEGLNADRLRLQDIKWVVVTHVHPDHYGLASKIRQLYGAKVAMHRIEAGLIDLRYVNFTELLNQLEEMLRLNGVPQEELPQLKEASLWARQFVTPDQPEIMLEDGDKISNGSFEIEVLLTPGHSPGHICLYEPRKKLLFTGDHVLYDTTRALGDNLKTAYQVAHEIRWMPEQGGVAFQSLSTWDRRMAVTETIAHLKLLMVEGKVGNADMGGASFYLAKD
jgi:glyoxylase-like metal-dependent hydrolase (beta-lactamase superfamily II)